MTVADFLDALKTKAVVTVLQSGSPVIELRNADGVSDKLSADVSGATVESIEMTGSTSVSVSIESAP